MQNKNKIKQIVKNNCACYLGDKHGISNYCCLRDGSCVFFGQENPIPRCIYFENGVLSTDEKLEGDYKLERNVKVEYKAALGLVEVAAVGVTNSILQVYFAIFLTLGVTSTVMTATEIGAGNIRKQTITLSGSEDTWQMRVCRW